MVSLYIIRKAEFRNTGSKTSNGIQFDFTQFS